MRRDQRPLPACCCQADPARYCRRRRHPAAAPHSPRAPHPESGPGGTAARPAGSQGLREAAGHPRHEPADPRAEPAALLLQQRRQQHGSCSSSRAPASTAAAGVAAGKEPLTAGTSSRAGPHRVAQLVGVARPRGLQVAADLQGGGEVAARGVDLRATAGGVAAEAGARCRGAGGRAAAGGGAEGLKHSARHPTQTIRPRPPTHLLQVGEPAREEGAGRQRRAARQQRGVQADLPPVHARQRGLHVLLKGNLAACRLGAGAGCGVSGEKSSAWPPAGTTPRRLQVVVMLGS